MLGLNHERWADRETGYGDSAQSDYTRMAQPLDAEPLKSTALAVRMAIFFSLAGFSPRQG
jgi:hypothetical protein